MAVTSKTKPGRPMGAPKPRGTGKWWALGVVGLGTFLAVETGWAGFGFAHLRSRVYPNDTALLGWVPGEAGGVVVIDPHQVELQAFGKEGGSMRSVIQSKREDVKRITGIDLMFDVDKLAITSSLVVARGRFDGKKLAEEMAAYHYAVAEHHGEVYLVRAGEDAIGVVDGSVLLYGDEPAVQAAIDAHAAGTTLAKNDDVTARLGRVGWNHAMLGTVRIVDDRPSLRAVLTGSTGPRAATFGVTTTLAGLDVDTRIEAASPAAAAELTKLLEEKRANAETVKSVLGSDPATSDAATALQNIAKKTTLVNQPPSADVEARAHVDVAQLDTLSKSVRSAVPITEAFKAMRLIQLLAP